MGLEKALLAESEELVGRFDDACRGRMVTVNESKNKVLVTEGDGLVWFLFSALRYLFPV